MTALRRGPSSPQLTSESHRLKRAATRPKGWSDLRRPTEKKKAAARIVETQKSTFTTDLGALQQ